MTETLFEELKRYVGFTEEDGARLRAAAPAIRERIAPIVDLFYEAILRHEGTRVVITGGDAQVQRLKRTLEEWTVGVFGGPYDEAYFARRARIGRMHVDVGVQPKFMIAAMALFRTNIKRALAEKWTAGPADLADLFLALDRILDVELAIALDAYHASYMERLDREARLATIGQIAASVSHELKNPVGVIKMSVFALRTRLENVTDERVRSHLEKIDRNASRASAIVSGLLEFVRSRPPDRRLKLDLNAVVREAAGHVTLPDGVALESSLDPALPRVAVDEVQIGQVVTNLVANAVEAMPHGGLLRLRTGMRSPSEAGIEVQDTGVGISEENLRRIFEPLFTTKSIGTGLGLSTCKKIVEAHSGRIEVESRPGAGSLFRVVVPVEAR